MTSERTDESAAAAESRRWPAFAMVAAMLVYGVLVATVLAGRLSYRWVFVALGAGALAANAQLADTFQQLPSWQRRVPRRIHQAWIIALGAIFIVTGLFGSWDSG